MDDDNDGILGSFLAAFIGLLIWDSVKRDREAWRKNGGTRMGILRDCFSVGNWRTNIKVLCWCAVIIAYLIYSAHGQTINRTYQDSMGRNVGRSSTDTRGNTTFYDNMGRNTGRSSTQNGTTTIYDNMGRQTGTIRSNR